MSLVSDDSPPVEPVERPATSHKMQGDGTVAVTDVNMGTVGEGTSMQVDTTTPPSQSSTAITKTEVVADPTTLPTPVSTEHDPHPSWSPPPIPGSKRELSLKELLGGGSAVTAEPKEELGGMVAAAAEDGTVSKDAVALPCSPAASVGSGIPLPVAAEDGSRVPDSASPVACENGHGDLGMDSPTGSPRIKATAHPPLPTHPPEASPSQPTPVQNGGDTSMASLESAMAALKLRLSEAVSLNNWSDLSAALHDCYAVTADSHVLSTTRIGAEVNRLKNEVPTKELRRLCVRVVRKWKRDIGMLPSLAAPAKRRASSESDDEGEQERGIGARVRGRRRTVAKVEGRSDAPTSARAEASAGRRKSTARGRGNRITVDTSRRAQSPTVRPATASATVTGHVHVQSTTGQAPTTNGTRARKRRASLTATGSPVQTPTMPPPHKTLRTRAGFPSRSHTMAAPPPPPPSESEPKPSTVRRASHSVIPSPRMTKLPPYTKPPATPDPEIRSLQSDHLDPPPEIAENKVRLGGLQVLYRSLASHTEEASEKVLGIAKEIEGLIFEQAWEKKDVEGEQDSSGPDSAAVISPSDESGDARAPSSMSDDDDSSGGKSEPEPKWSLRTYRQRTLMYSFNLSNALNLPLKHSVLAGELGPARLVQMTKEEMEPARFQEERRRCEEQRERDIKRLTEIQSTPVQWGRYERKVRDEKVVEVSRESLDGV